MQRPQHVKHFYFIAGCQPMWLCLAVISQTTETEVTYGRVNAKAHVSEPFSINSYYFGMQHFA